ncbi:MAG: acyl-CoA thioesterase-1 [Sulfurimonas sp.]
MMNKITLAAILLFSTLAIIIYMKESTEDLSKNTLKKEAVILAFGDSLTYGYGVSKSFSYPARLELKTGLKVINAGVSGEVSSEGLVRLSEMLEQKPDLVILCHGANDIMRKLSLEELKSNLIKMIRLIKASGAKVILVAAPDFKIFGFATFGLYNEVADEEDVILENNILTHIELDRTLKSDYVHPNEKGYDLMAETFLDILKNNQFLP